MCPPLEDSLPRLIHPASLNEFSLEERSCCCDWPMNPSCPLWTQVKYPLVAPTSHLAEPRGVFTTLYYRGEFARLRRLLRSREPALSHSGRERAWRCF